MIVELLSVANTFTNCPISYFVAECLVSWLQAIGNCFHVSRMRSEGISFHFGATEYLRCQSKSVLTWLSTFSLEIAILVGVYAFVVSPAAVCAGHLERVGVTCVQSVVCGVPCAVP